MGRVDQWGHLVVESCGELPLGFSELASNVGDTVCLGFGDERLLDPTTKIRTRPSGECQSQRQCGAMLTGLTTMVVYSCRRCGCNLHNAICNRHGVRRPRPTTDFAHATLYLDVLIPELFRELVAETASFSDEDWLHKWSEAKQLVLLRSRQFEAVKAHRIKSMVKYEVYTSCPRKARAIQYYLTLATQMEVSPEVFRLQKALGRILRRRCLTHRIRVTFASGMSDVEMSTWMQCVLVDMPGAWFYERDGKNWDATQGVEHYRLKRRCYELLDSTTLEVLDQSFRVTCATRTAEGMFVYLLDGTMKSGHADTTVGNSIVNFLVTYQALLDCGLYEADIIVAGDDCLVALPRDFDEAQLRAAESACGIVPESRKLRSHVDVSFISGVWCENTPGTLAFVPKPGRLLARLFWTVNFPSLRQLDAFRHSIVAGLQHSCGGMPVIGAFLKANDVSGAGLIETGKRMAYVFKSAVVYDRDTIMRWFCARYGIGPGDISDVETLLLGVTGRVGVVKHGILDRICEVDLADLADRELVLPG